jgi:hypothetical protein
VIDQFFGNLEAMRNRNSFRQQFPLSTVGTFPDFCRSRYCQIQTGNVADLDAMMRECVAASGTSPGPADILKRKNRLQANPSMTMTAIFSMFGEDVEDSIADLIRIESQSQRPLCRALIAQISDLPDILRRPLRAFVPNPAPLLQRLAAVNARGVLRLSAPITNASVYEFIEGVLL